MAYGGPVLFACFLKLTQDSLALVHPILLEALLSYISAYQDSKWTGLMGTVPFPGYVIAVLMFATSMAQTVILQQVIGRYLDH